MANYHRDRGNISFTLSTSFQLMYSIVEKATIFSLTLKATRWIDVRDRSSQTTIGNTVTPFSFHAIGKEVDWQPSDVNPDKTKALPQMRGYCPSMYGHLLGCKSMTTPYGRFGCLEKEFRIETTSGKTMGQGQDRPAYHDQALTAIEMSSFEQNVEHLQDPVFST